jgi:thiamine-monophosphate kinase
MISLMKVSEVGEFGLIQLLSREFGIDYPPRPGAARRAGVIVDLGDDALVLAPTPGATIWTTDTMVEGVHFLPARTPWRNTGWKAIAVNVSDIAAMGGTPSTALVTLALPATFCVEDAIELYRGMRECCDAFDITLGGGDIVRSPVFSVTVALSGLATTLDSGEVAVLTRSAASPGDAIAVTGTLGDSAAGLRLLQAEDQPDDLARALVQAHERPQPRVQAGLSALRGGIRCGMDISDGLLQDLGHITRASGVSATLEVSHLPLSPQLRRAFPAEAPDLALTGGEDYQLLLCGPRDVFERLIVEGLDLTLIGEIATGDPAVHVRLPDGTEKSYPSGGWDHFRGA